MSKRSMRILSVFAFGAIGLAMLSPSFAVGEKIQDNKKVPNVQNPPKGAKDSPQVKAVCDLELAARLIQYGRANKNAESLLLAAQVLQKTPTQPLKVDHTAEKGAANAPAPMKRDNSPKALLAEAKKLSSSPSVEALAAATQKIIDEETRGALGGAKVDGFTIRSGETINWNPITFVGGQKAVVFIDNGVYGSMILDVIDQFGNVVVRDNVPGTFYTVSWYPLVTGPYRIRLTNVDTISFACGLATN